MGRDDVTELTFRGWDHLKQVFSSNWVKTKLGPDGPLFADFETTMALLATEEPVPLPYEMRPTADDGFATVATYFLATPDNERHGCAVQDKVQTLLVRALSENARQEVYIRWRLMWALPAVSLISMLTLGAGIIRNTAWCINYL